MTPSPLRFRATALVLTGMIVLGTGVTGTAVAAGPPVALVENGGDAQSVQTGHAFPDNLITRVLDADDEGVAGVQVTFAIQPISPGYTGTAGFTGGFQSVVVTSDAEGYAYTSAPDSVLTAGAIGDLVITATTPGVAEPVTFTQTSAAPLPLVDFVDGDAQTAGTRLPFDEPVTAIVNDEYGEPLVGWPVTFELQTGGFYTATATFPGGQSSVTLLTGADGRVTSPGMTAGPTVGQVQILAYGAADSFAAGVLTVVDAPPAYLLQVSGGGQSATVGESFADPFVVSVLDANGYPAAGGVQVLFSLDGFTTFADGTSDATVQVDDAGHATSPVVVAGVAPGTATVDVMVIDSALEPTRFVATVVAAPATTTSAVGGSDPTTAPSSAAPPHSSTTVPAGTTTAVLPSSSSGPTGPELAATGVPVGPAVSVSLLLMVVGLALCAFVSRMRRS
ncbi:hypothetical protein GIS00_13280 [Nakamurella sp. YIM 132087]|uniref:Big-1 domain-containing protein n=1 Tax=Nakamurella alba TaxID=2665158 RepID=A0A7K1FL86_9ACTN|nr:hypothetical protein [Nakamurella alba]MTD14912.1 hypothetical protein [Nakamurella alba]